MKTKILILTMFVLVISNAFSQDTLLLLSGKIYAGQISENSKNFIRIWNDKSFINSSKLIYKDEIYSFVKNNKTTVLYKPDSNNGLVFNNAEMLSFIKGLQDGKKQYHAPLSTVGGFVAGATGGVFGFWGTVIPSTYIFIAGIKTPTISMVFPTKENMAFIENPYKEVYGLQNTIKPEITPTEEQIYYPYYQYGYEISAKDKKIKNAVKGSIIGFVAFIATSYLVIHK